MLFFWNPAKCMMHFATVFTVKLQVRCLALEMGEGNESIFSKFTDDTKVTSGVDTYEAWIILQIDLERVKSL